jgi:tRNA (cytidine56-2'-O)-methyltransferase
VNIEVLRLGHRPQRDKRITTHVCLTARALGAKAITIAESDRDVEQSVQDVVRRFGGDFHIRSGAGWKGPIRSWQPAGQVVHLTMYGIPLTEAVTAIRADGRDVLVVVGAEKVPGDLYAMADHNVAVGNQPHSEVAALALLLERLRGGAWEQDPFPGGQVAVRPSARGKDITVRASARDASPDSAGTADGPADGPADAGA